MLLHFVLRNKIVLRNKFIVYCLWFMLEVSGSETAKLHFFFFFFHITVNFSDF